MSGFVALASSAALAADPPLAPTIYQAPAAVREPPPRTGLYGGLNAGYGWANQALKETGDTVTGGQQAVNAGAIPASLAGGPSGFVGGGQLGANYQINRAVFGNRSRLAMGELDRQSDGVHERSRV